MASKMFWRLLLTAAILLAGCRPAEPVANMANPASVYCEENGGQLAMVSSEQGEHGVCRFPDGSSCEEWAFYRGECSPGKSLTTPQPSAVVTLEPQSSGDSWLEYRSPDGAYIFRYPSNAQVTASDDPLNALTILGPQVNGENWPVIYISHPADRVEYRPPEDVVLEQWLVQHNLLSPDSERLADTRIAGASAVHLRRAGSAQSYPADIYYFADTGQLYAITILHAGNQEDWSIYEQFLDSFKFIR